MTELDLVIYTLAFSLVACIWLTYMALSEEKE